MKFSTPLPIPKDAVVLTEAEKSTIQKYLDRKRAADIQVAVAEESLNDICMAIAARAGQTSIHFSLSADLGFLMPIKENPDAVRNPATDTAAAEA